MIFDLTPQEREQALRYFAHGRVPLKGEVPLTQAQQQGEELMRLTSTDAVHHLQVANYFSRKVTR